VTYVWPLASLWKNKRYGQLWKYFYVVVSSSPSYIIPVGQRSPVHIRRWTGQL